MATKEVTVKCSKETVEAGLGLAAFIGHMKAALADGWQIGQDLPAVITAALGDLVPALQGAEKIKDEVLEDKVAFANACTVTGSAVVGALIK